MSGSPSLFRAVRNQRRAALLALILAVAAFWVSVPLGRWEVGAFLAAGILLGLVNHVLTEHVLLRSVESGDMITRKEYATTSLVRLLGVSLVAIVLSVVFWPVGATVLFGLAIFHLITIVLTGIPLLKEVRKV
ncbi:MAG: hypothetical protein ACRDO8_01210 [Nocardioidaceae bacterium]